MADWNDTRQQQTGFSSVPRAGDAVARQTTYDTGLRAHMLSIYNYMTSGVLLTGIVALLVARSGFVYNIMGGPLLWIAMLAPLAIVFAMSFGANRFSETTLKAMYWAYAALMGVSLSTIFVVYTGGSIAATFFATAGAFAGLSLFGYTTKKDLSGFGTFLIMGVVGLIVASLLNVFIFHSTALELAVSVLGVLIFAGLTAYDTQRLKEQYSMLRGTAMAGKAVVLGALKLYLDFINMFLFLLRFMGNRN